MTDRPDDVAILKELLSEDPSEELLEQIASTVVAEFEDAFPELSLKPRPILDVLDDFREKKLEEVETTRHYRTKLDYIQQYLTEEVAAETTDDLTSEDIERYEDWRKYESLSREKPLEDNTLTDDMYLFREFVRYLVKHRMVPIRFKELIEIPDVDYKSGEGVDDTKLDPQRAQAALEYLRKYKYADVEHVTVELLCQTARRRSAVAGLDVSDYNNDDSDDTEPTLDFVHRESTTLKNDEASEHEMQLDEPVPTILDDYLEENRPSVTDEEGREPLLTAGDGRLSPETVKKYAYKWSRPCKIGSGCPHDRDPDTCEAAQNNNSAYRCPSSRSPHQYRTGYITDQRNRGVSAEAVDIRCDVSPRVQDLHYDQPDDSAEQDRVEDEFRNADDDPDSGFCHS